MFKLEGKPLILALSIWNFKSQRFLLDKLERKEDLLKKYEEEQRIPRGKNKTIQGISNRRELKNEIMTYSRDSQGSELTVSFLTANRGE